MASGGGAFAKCLGHEGRVVVNDMVILKQRPQRAHYSFHSVRTRWEGAGCEQEEGVHQSVTMLAPPSFLILDFPASGTWRNRLLLLISYLVSVTLLQQPKLTKAVASKIHKSNAVALFKWWGMTNPLKIWDSSFTL